jgi:hypothetical protein
MDKIPSLQNQRRSRTGVPSPQNRERKSAKRRSGEPASLSPLYFPVFSQTRAEVGRNKRSALRHVMADRIEFR